MNRWIRSIALSTCLLGTLATITITPRQQASAQFQSNDLSYSFFGQNIPLTPQPDVIAVAFREQDGVRGVAVPLHLQLEADLRGESSGTRGPGASSPASALDVAVQPIGDRYALVTLPTGVRGLGGVDQTIRQRPYVESTLPVLTVGSDTNGESQSQVILPNEILITLEPDLSNSQIQILLNRYDLEIVRSLQFSDNRHIVRSRREEGLAVLEVANRLNRVVGIQSATPNFIQSVPYRVQEQDIGDLAFSETPNTLARLQQLIATGSQPETPFPSTLLPLAWHLDSTPQRGRLLPRTDIHATEAWDISNGGEGVVVAVIDSLIQWDHPDLAENLYAVSDHPNQLPGEEYGWDFTSPEITCRPDQPNVCVTGDPDTRISDEELAYLRPHFQNTFRLTDDELVEEYSGLAYQLNANYPNLSSTRIASIIRTIIRNDIAAEFHGTWSAGVVAARPDDGEGAIGVAPNARILPVRVFGIGGEITSERLIEAVGYAADRGVDVINMSLGGILPDQAFVNQIFQVLDEHPDLVIVASAGNDNLDGVGFPAATPGVLSVGATNMEGRRTFYSSYGGRLDLVAPGGETSLFQRGGILTTGGTGVDGFWRGMEIPTYGWGPSLDPLGDYVQVQGTSFSAPAVAGVVALMKGVNPDLERDRLLTILKDTASYDGLSLSQGDLSRYRLQREVGLTMMDDRLSGLFSLPTPISAEQYFFGAGLVNAEAAVRAAR